MRDQQPVWQDGHGVWHVFRHEDVQRVLSDPALFSSDPRLVMPDWEGFARGNLVSMDPPDHRRLRKLVSQVFTPRMVAGLEPRIVELCGELLDDVGDELELVSGFACPLPMTVIADLLGVPHTDRDLFRTWADRLLSVQVPNPADPSAAQLVQETIKDLNEYLLEHCRDRRAHERDDLIGKLVATEVARERLDDEEVVNFARLLLLAGHVTTTMLLGNALLCLDENPGAAEELRADRTLVPRALEEVVRLRPPFIERNRVATAPVELSGVTIPELSIVSVSLFSANHDERVFTEPERFDIHREQNPHVGYGKGIHFCLGAPLARLEGKLALEQMFDRFKEIRVSDAVEFHEHGFSGVTKLPLAVQRGAVSRGESTTGLTWDPREGSHRAR
ncbi:MAG: cytochrome P450 [Pseudonocardiaceae bacterium]